MANNKRIIAVTRNLGFFTNGYNYLTQLIPLVIVAPMYMQGRVEFGVVTQSAMAFSAFLSGFSLIVTQFETLSSFAAVTTRLDTIAQALEQARTPGGIARSRSRTTNPGSRYENLSLWTRHERHPLINDLTLEVVHGSNLLITGPDTAAETALFLATAGFWDEGKGRIIRPGPDGIYFVPKQPLTVRCTLRSQLVGRLTRAAVLRCRDPCVAREAEPRRRCCSASAGSTPTCTAPAPSRRPNSACSSSPGSCSRSPRFVFLDRLGASSTRNRSTRSTGCSGRHRSAT